MSAETWRVVLDDGSVREAPRVERVACKAAVLDAAAVDDNGLPWCNCLDALIARSITRTVPARLTYPVDAEGRAVES